MTLIRDIRDLVKAWWNSAPPPNEWSYSHQAGEVVGLIVMCLLTLGFLGCVLFLFIKCCFPS